MPIPRKSNDDFFAPDPSFLDYFIPDSNDAVLYNDDDDDGSNIFPYSRLISRYMFLFDDILDFGEYNENDIEETNETYFFEGCCELNTIDFDSFILYNCEVYCKKMYHKENYSKNYLEIIKMTNLLYEKFKEIKIRQNVIGSKKTPRVKFRENENRQILYLSPSQSRKRKKEKQVISQMSKITSFIKDNISCCC